MTQRWPRSLHSQIEAVFHGIRSFRMAKTDDTARIRSFGSWKTYRYEAHRFADFLLKKSRTNILETSGITCDMEEYLSEKFSYFLGKNRSRQTMETMLSAMGKLEYAINHYIKQHCLDILPLKTERLRLEFYAQSKARLRKSSRVFDNRAYPDPIRLIENISDPTFQLQASLQFEGGLRAEGVGAPSNRRVKNPLTNGGLHGTGNDPVTGNRVGIVSVKEKGGKETEHFISQETYNRLENYLQAHSRLESDYAAYVEAINRSARETGQYAPGRGSHGLKHNFAQERYLECIAQGMSHEQALQHTSLETAHFRMRETLTYTCG